MRIPTELYVVVDLGDGEAGERCQTQARRCDDPGRVAEQQLVRAGDSAVGDRDRQNRSTHLFARAPSRRRLVVAVAERDVVNVGMVVASMQELSTAACGSSRYAVMID